jgi:N-acetylmuramoyl-L-alanine amidase
MIKRVALLLAIVLLSTPLYADPLREITARFGRQDNGMRLVLESDADFIRNTNILTSLSGIRVEFLSAFEVKKARDFPYEITARDRFLYINLKDKDVIDIKVLKLSAPPRLVFDLKTVPKPLGRPNEQSEQRGLHTPSQQSAQKAPQPAQQPLGQMQQTAQKNQSGLQSGQKNQPQEKTRRIRVVVIDPGHGGYDYGMFSATAAEKDTDLVLSRDLANALTRAGRTVYMTRKADQYVSIGDRIRFSNSKNPDLFISIHSSLSEAFTIYTSAVEDLNIDAAVKPYSLVARQNRHIENSREISKDVGDSIKKELSGVVSLSEMPLPLLNALNAPAILIEYPSFKYVPYDQKMRERLVSSILKGIEVYEQ